MKIGMRLSAAVPLLRSQTRLAILFGSQAGGKPHPESDIDLAILPRGGVDLFALQGELGSALRTDRVDLVDLRRASGLLQQIVATRGKLLWEERSGSFAEFAVVAERRWGDDRRAIRLEWEALRSWLDRRRAL